ncbi:DNA repair nuclease, XPF-type/Helicase [Metarhizium album ARSEF 1941]|uniref:Crossover junction endonuclease MUS81 n=1 Tax=Metarhizium album (strain ARSEF 1941) TaxID=1081103 RepID=A0A0B2WH20_METAS|nr:DNA repair nuclease, XPF-type/Helicase [Metarhizium album ARSEF 1941]KHN95281.1 DNA repair nuclease, XPF-type/Helicase [Metarhizium album ARSEF 1941]
MEEECPNPLLLTWVKEWLDTARERNSKGFTTYRNAHESLKACPLVFHHPAELQQLKGFGPKLCERLTDKLQKYCQENHLPMPEHPQVRKAAKKAQLDEETAAAAAAAEGGSAPKKRKVRQPKAYVPSFRSGAYALLVGLSTQPDDTTSGMTKADLIQVSQPHCDSSFTAPSDPTKFYTAWNSMKTLVQKELVYERGRPLRRYLLTDEGWEVARRIKETREWKADNNSNNNNADAAHAASVRPARSPPAEIEVVERDTAAEGNAVDGSLPAFQPIKLVPGSFSVRLVLDVREVRAKTDRDYMQEELAKLDAAPLMRSLEVGDAQWVAKCHDPTLLQRLGAEGDEVVLDWIVERKRLDDLIGSIKDGRFHEQKFRLRRSGVQNVIYIIEDITMDPQTLQRYEEAVQSAIASTQVVNGYFVKRTSKMDETVRYLSRLTAVLKRKYEKQPLHVIPSRVITAQNYAPLLRHLRETQPSVGHYVTYQAFSSLASKSEMMTLRDVFLKMLMTTRGVTGERALEIQRRWRTPHDFVKAFEACGSGETGRKRKRELVSSQLGHFVGRKSISKALSQRISEVWGDA